MTCSDDDSNGYEVSCSMHEHFEDFKKWMETTAIMNERIHEMHRDTKYLANLPTIVEELRSLRETLVGAATGKNHIPLAATLPVISAMAFCILILGGLLMSFHTGGDFKITPSSIEMRNHGNNTPKTDSQGGFNPGSNHTREPSTLDNARTPLPG